MAQISLIKRGNNLDRDGFKEVCDFLCLYYEDIRDELNNLKYAIDMLAELAANYLDSSFIRMYVSHREFDLKLDYLSSFTTRIEKLKEGSTVELFQNMNLFDLKKEFFQKNDKSEIILRIWKSRHVVDDISYQFERIVNAKEDANKQIAILKGIIAYY